jgi:hypothetical protein
MPFNLSPQGEILPFSDAQVAAMGIETYGIEDGDHPTFTREVNQSTMRVKYMVNPDTQSLDNFFCYMLGGASMAFGFGTGNYLSRLLPQQLTYEGVTYSNFGAVKIEDAHGQQFSVDDVLSNPVPIATYTKFYVTVLYQQFPFQLLTDQQIADMGGDENLRYVQQLPTNSQVDYLNLPGTIGRYVTNPPTPIITPLNPANAPNGYPVPYGTGFPSSQSIVQRKWIRIPYTAWGEGSDLYATLFGDYEGLTPAGPFIGLVGTVNTEAFLGYPAGTLLMLAPEEELVMDPTGGLSWNLTYRFLFKPQGHNFFYYFPSGAATGLGAGWYFVNITSGDSLFYNRTFPMALLPDGVCYFNSRNFQVAFQV